MSYRLRWRLVGRGNRVLDSGEIDSGFPDWPSGVQALAAFLQQFAQWGRDTEEGTWWARRSPDADLLVQISLQVEGTHEPELMPGLWTAPQGEDAPLRS
jgi:hypothetical protein